MKGNCIQCVGTQLVVSQQNLKIDPFTQLCIKCVGTELLVLQPNLNIDPFTVMHSMCRNASCSFTTYCKSLIIRKRYNAALIRKTTCPRIQISRDYFYETYEITNCYKIFCDIGLFSVYQKTLIHLIVSLFS
jgi:hypothetical protein